ncbi:hypothetical protein EHRUM3_07650, partial [Ehrlichia ruminantium]
KFIVINYNYNLYEWVIVFSYRYFDKPVLLKFFLLDL